MNLLLLVLVIAGGGLFWSQNTEESCWKNEATEAFQKYASLNTRSDILRTAYGVENTKSNPLVVIERDPNGCSLGSNGQTVIHFAFDSKDKLTSIKVFRNYLTSDPSYKMELIEERNL